MILTEKIIYDKFYIKGYGMKKYLLFIVLFTIIVSTTTADDLADILQDLAVQTACLGMYSTAQTGVYVTSRYDDPIDWYDPPMLANRFAAMSGNMTRINTFYGVCFDYAQFAWDDIKSYQKLYNDAGMKGQQWYIAVTNKNDPYTIILYDPVSRENATIISNGVYLKENSRHRVYAHDGATGHAWLWVQHNNGTWYWIDPTWTDNTGYPWWGKVENGIEVKYYPDPEYCVASNYPSPFISYPDTRISDSSSTQKPQASTPSEPRNSNSTSRTTPNSTPSSTNSRNYNYIGSILGYNYSLNLPVGWTIGIFGFYTSINFQISDFSVSSSGGISTDAVEITAGYSFNIVNGLLRLPIGIGLASYNANIEFENLESIVEAGLQLIFLRNLYLSATYRLISFSRGGFTVGTGFVF